MQIREIKAGDRLYWNDPDAGICSGWVKVAGMQNELDEDSIVFVEKEETGDEFEVPACELSENPPSENS